MRFDFVYKLWETIDRYLDKLIAVLPKLLLAGIVIAASAFIAIRLSGFIRSKLRHRMRDKLLVDFIARLLRGAMILAGLALALEIAGFGGVAGSLLAGAGITAFVVGFAFKDIGENFLAGIILAFKRPFEIGDIIQSGSVKGRVVTLDLRTTNLKNADGTDVYVPNSAILKEALFNFTRDGHERYSFTIEVAPEISLQAYKTEISAALEGLDGVDGDRSPSITVEKYSPEAMELRVYYWINHFRFTGDVHLLQGEAQQRIGALLRRLAAHTESREEKSKGTAEQSAKP